MLFLRVFQHFRLLISGVGFYFFMVLFTLDMRIIVISLFLCFHFLDYLLSRHSNFIKVFFHILSVLFFLLLECFLLLFALLLRKVLFHSFFFLHLKLAISDLFMAFNSICLILTDFLATINSKIRIFRLNYFIFRPRLHM